MYTLKPLPYPYDALEPWIDAKTMEVHHDKHHQTYCDKFNEAVGKHSELFEKEPEELLKQISSVPEDIRSAVKNHGGGFVNHNLFWQCMGISERHTPSGDLLVAVERDFGSFESFKERFGALALGQFGSGWVWLTKDSSGILSVMNLPNQDSPLSVGLTPILCLDVWEHAYYLKYQNKRAEYIQNWWNVVHWEVVETLYKQQ